MFYTVHFLWCDFIREDICCAVDLEGIAVDDLTLEGLCKVNAQLRFACPRASYTN